MYEKNVGQIDRIIRVILGIIFAVLMIYFILAGATLDLVLAGIFAILAIIMFVTAFFGTCPLWSVLKINTNKA